MVQRAIHRFVWFLLGLAMTLIMTSLFFILPPPANNQQQYYAGGVTLDEDFLFLLDPQQPTSVETSRTQTYTIDTGEEKGEKGGDVIEIVAKKVDDDDDHGEQQQQQQEEEGRGRLAGNKNADNSFPPPPPPDVSVQPKIGKSARLKLKQNVKDMMHLDLQNQTCSKWIIYTPAAKPASNGLDENEKEEDLLLQNQQQKEQLLATVSFFRGKGWCTLIVLSEDKIMENKTRTARTYNDDDDDDANHVLSNICHLKFVYCKTYNDPLYLLPPTTTTTTTTITSTPTGTKHFDSSDDDYCHGGGSKYVIQCKLLKMFQLSPCQLTRRRNYGYLLAMLHGAESIFDLGEQYQIKPEMFVVPWWSHNNDTAATATTTTAAAAAATSTNTTWAPESPLSAMISNHHLEVSVVIQGRSLFNPFPLLQKEQNHYDCPMDTDAITNNNNETTSTSIHRTIHWWPRGFPGLCMGSLSHQYSKGKIAFLKNVSLASQSASSVPPLPFLDKSYRIGVIQLVPDGFQDMDNGSQEQTKSYFSPHKTNPLMVPSHSFAPYNMHSTFYTHDALWSLILPTTTLPQRYADIVRSYFAQCLFPDIGLRLVYMPSVVSSQNASRQPRNFKSNIRSDISDIEVVHKRIESLILYLSQWDSPFHSLPARMEHLWKDLYSRNYISKRDLELVQSWILYLNLIGYKFPKLIKRRFRNVAVLGHFNYAKSPSQVDDVVFWTQKYREWFETVVVSGPFEMHQIQELKRHSITAFRGDRNEEGGYFQVTENLKNVLLYFKNHSNIESVMYFHDDGMVNVTELSKGQYPFPTHEIIGNYRDQRYDLSYADIRKIQDVELANKFSYRIYPNGTVCAFNRLLCQPSVKDLYKALPLYPWGMTTKGYCGVSQQKLAGDEEIFPYHEDDGALLFSSFTQSDFLHIPTMYAEEFGKLASLFLKHNVIHECAWGTIVDMIRKKYNATVRLTMLCTSWGPKRRGKKALIERCLRDSVDYGVIHPFKIGFEENGYRGYDWAFDSVQR